MQSDFVKVICQMGIFMICAQAIVHFRPKASYEKYLKLLVSVIVVMQMLLFVGGIFSTNGENGLKERVEYFTASMEKSVEEAAKKAFFSEEELELEITGAAPRGDGGEGKEGVGATEITVDVAPVEQLHIDNVQIQ